MDLNIKKFFAMYRARPAGFNAEILMLNRKN